MAGSSVDGAVIRRCGVVVALLVARAAQAQWGVWVGDSLLAAGRLAAAESAYYAASAANPRDPRARAALGRFLAARGGSRAGAVLIEEARFFGGDSIALARALVPIYERLRDYAAIDSLTPNVLSPPERRRARWLKDRRPDVAFADSVVLLSYRPMADGQGIGTLLLRVGKTELPAVIDPRVSGLVLPAAMRAELRTFGGDANTTLAALDAARVGGVTFTNIPATLSPATERVRIGFDVLAAYSPSFDPRRGIMTLRRAERRVQPRVGTRVPALFDGNGLRLLVGEGWHASGAAMPAMLLATRSWMWDARRGDVVLIQ